jgi:hypothetical protein
VTDEGISQDIMERHYDHMKEELKNDIETLDPIVREALNIYIKWLNQPQGPFGSYNFEFDDFFRWTITHEDKTSWDRHYETRIISDLTIPDRGRFIVLSAGTADEGGPATLYVLTDLDSGQIVQITQEFDTLFSLVYFDTLYSPTGGGEPSKGIVPFSWSPQEDPGDSSRVGE